MTRQFQPVQTRRVFEEILVQVQESLASGDLVRGDRLPAERDLADQFGASRTSVREALRVLEAHGVIQVKPGSENGATLVTHPARAFRDLLGYQIALRHIDVAALIEFRIVVESWAAGAAADRHNRASAQALAELVDKMTEDLEYPEFFEVDAAFHLEIAKASGNDLFALTLEGARTAIGRVMVEAMASVANHDWNTIQSRLVSEHTAISEAIVVRDRTRAECLMATHIRDFYAAHLERHVAKGPAVVVSPARDDRGG